MSSESEITEHRLKMASSPKRPVFFDLFRLQFPVGSIASFLHRVSGVLMIVSLPFLVYAFGRSLAGPTEFAALATSLGSPFAKLILLVLFWALAHHVLAGIRHLLMDGGVGWPLSIARRTAWTVNIAGVVVALLFAARLLL